MTLFARNKPAAEDPRLEGLVCVGEVTRYPTDRRNRRTGPVTYEVFAERNNFAKVRYYRDSDGNLMVPDPGPAPPPPEHLGVVRRRDPARQRSQEKSDQVEQVLDVTPERMALMETLNPGSTIPLRKMLRMRGS